MKRSTRLFVLTTATLSTLACSLLKGVDHPQATTVVVAASDESPAPESFSLVALHPEQGELKAMLTAHAGRAAAIDRNPFVEFSADWCPPCVALANSLTDQRMVDAFRGTYIIRLDFDEWKDRLSGTGFTVVGVPTFFELDGAGAPTGRVITGAAWGEDIPENMAPTLRAFFRNTIQE
jgi:thiol-disulfide isomerase/thioredoxin